ncbi:MAG: ATP-binding cassette domain-containing protein [Vicinamibacterales bacterium]
MRPPLLEFDAVSYVRGETTVLDQVTLRIDCGEHTAIVGRNGAGKSSLIQLLTHDGYPLAPADGRSPIRLFGRDRWDVFELRSRLGIVTGDLHGRFTGGTWVGRVSGLDAVISGFLGSQALFDHHDVTPEMRRDAERALERVGAGYLSGKRLDHMSTGEARRVLIARALVRTPDALVLDEPTTGLDVVARHQFMEAVRQIARDGVTIILVTQHLDEIFPEIERVVLIHDGRVADDGAKDSVLRGPAIERAFGAPLVVEEHDGYYDVRPAR